ncbi:hypothetical protein SLH46_12875 [Draconibacterium sp. IB214405]|uniref:hypothetical protein n=1 Tax=Draconibacterium sp. IB214405 TaxID=3097352 RepID=UPI002A0E68CE|nr:hypothetical protein [Draconibacterium sp. IB214405]MDX8340087.1 hypothetical protein [Draconibacterium sp. IB214405]
MNEKFVKEQIIQRQYDWGNGIIRIGKIFKENGDIVKAATELVESMYGYKEGTVLFKPTKATDPQFRKNQEEAVSYFIGGNDKFPEDQGFALQPWEKVRFENHGYIANYDLAISMGNYFFMDKDGNETKVEYTMGFFKNANGKLKLNLHHSSFPFSQI